ncbi:MAG TPA: UDP-N-acetylglucosamine 2-epimerase (non-hydrolyzing) [Bacillales bacterium]|nr:UDP-N-acetylglucosamine 2-epimerase (non-hydrolyzing) [Bacillales bacterium]
MKKILTVIGARPQFVKAAPVSRVLRKTFHEVLVDTGQHYDYNMAGVFFEELKIPKPDYHLGVGSGTHGAQTGHMLIKLEEVVLKESPHAMIVYGDTNSTLAAALVASKLHIPLFHIEAGLRSFNKQMPEEINRVLTDHVSSLKFVPTETAVRNLAEEGIREGVHLVGDVMYDAVLYNLKLAKDKYTLKDFGLTKDAYYLATIHRAENTDNRERLEAIFRSLDQLSGEKVVLPLHPRTKKKLVEIDLFSFVEQSQVIQLIDPVSYLEMLLLEKQAKGIITDSGGVQKEAYFAKVPCFTLRDQTEWVETVDIGWNRLVHPVQDDLRALIQSFEEPPYQEGLYGNGGASDKIARVITEYFR